MNESKDIFIEMQDQYERFLSMMLQRYVCEIPDGTLMGTWGHLVLLELRYFNGNYLKPFRSRNISFKKFDVLPMSVILTPAEVYDTYVEIDKNMLLDVKIYNSLIQKPKM